MARSRRLRAFCRFALPALCAVAAACGPGRVAPSAATSPLVGRWRAVLGSPGGELPFTLVVRDTAGGLRAVAVNGAEETPLSSVELVGARVVLRFDWYDSEITADLAADGGSLDGVWRKTVPEGDATLPFHAVRGATDRFLPAARAALDPGTAAALPTVAGSWAADFQDGDGSYPARAELAQEGNRVTGTFLTPTGDYRFLEGSYEAGVLRLSTFDGGHAFLFQARARDDGSLAGDFWSRDNVHESWTAVPSAADEEALPDPWREVGLTNDRGELDFTFPDLAGRPVSLDAEPFRGKVVVVNLFGSWCPNCNDEAPLLAAWDRRYREQGLRVLGLAYEYTGDAGRDRRQLRTYAERHGIDYPLLLAGLSDKAAAAATLPDLTAVVAYPTTLFLGRDGKVRKIYSGFSGPGTGEHYHRLVAELEALIQQLLAEPAPG